MADQAFGPDDIEPRSLTVFPVHRSDRQAERVGKSFDNGEAETRSPRTITARPARETLEQICRRAASQSTSRIEHRKGKRFWLASGG